MQFEWIKHEHRGIVLEELNLLPTRSVLQTTGNRYNRDTASVLRVCWGIPAQCLIGTFQTQFMITEIILQAINHLFQLHRCKTNSVPCILCIHVQDHQGQDQEWPSQLNSIFLPNACFIWVLWLTFFSHIICVVYNTTLSSQNKSSYIHGSQMHNDD